MEIIKLLENCTNVLNTNNIEQFKNCDSEFFSIATEQFVMNKIYFLLYNIYEQKYKNDNEKYKNIKKEINSNLTPLEICKKLNIKEKFCRNEEKPYKCVIDNVNKIYYEKCPKKKFEILTQCSLEIRSCILEYSNGCYELESMDDELPIVIYISTQIDVSNIFAELNMIDDYVKCSLRDELFQNKMITNLLSSLLYLNKCWNKTNLSFN